MIDIKWDQKFSVGHERIDHEHQVFLDLIRNVSRFVERPEDGRRDRVLRLLQEIRKYADFHFYSEENLMLDCAYPDYAEHREQHAQLLSSLDDRIHDFRADRVTLSDLVEFLFQWFALHTTTVDKRLAKYLAREGA